MTIASMISIFVLVIVYYPYFAAAVVPMLGVIYFAACFYRASAREVKRHEALRRSYVFSAFGEALSGTSTIRAYGVEAAARLRLENAIDDMNGAYFITFATQCWLSIRLDAVASLLALITTLLVVTNKFRVNPSTSALVLSYVLQSIGLIQFMVKQLAEVENNMNSTERIYHFGNELPSEELPGPLDIQIPPQTWPEHGEIQFEKAEMRYRQGLPLVLKGMDLHVKGGERIGIIGRTGAGKSSIMSCIFRLVELSGGRIVIDGLDISKIRLQDLRSRLAIIPQGKHAPCFPWPWILRLAILLTKIDPTLFRGTVRSNLDPFNQHTDLELWTVLRQSYLVDTPSNIENNGASSSSNQDQANEDEKANQNQTINLESPVTEEGMNFSLGQRQLMAL